MLQERLADMAQRLECAFAAIPRLSASNCSTSPLATDEELLAFHTKVARAIRDSDPGRLVAFEPPATRNFVDSARISSQPFPVGGATGELGVGPQQAHALDWIRCAHDAAHSVFASKASGLVISCDGTPLSEKGVTLDSQHRPSGGLRGQGGDSE